MIIMEGEQTANTNLLAAQSFSLTKERISPFLPLKVPGLPVLQAGLQRGALTEITGARSSGRMSLLLHILAQATARGDICALVDTSNHFHPASAVAAGVLLSRLVWIRCGGNSEHAMRAADLLLHAGGFGILALDMCEVRPQVLNRIPLSYWYRFRRAIENTPSMLVVCSSSAQTKACSQHLVLEQKRVA